MRTRVRLLGPTLVAALAIAVVGCAPEQESQASAEADLCGALAAFGDELQAFQELDPATAGVEDVQAQREAIDAAWNDVVATGADIPEADEQALDEAWQALALDIQNIPQDQPSEAVLADLQSSADEVRAVQEEIENGVDCT